MLDHVCLESRWIDATYLLRMESLIPGAGVGTWHLPGPGTYVILRMDVDIDRSPAVQAECMNLHASARWRSEN